MIDIRLLGFAGTATTALLSTQFLRRGKPEPRVRRLTPPIRPLRPHAFRTGRWRRHFREMLPSKTMGAPFYS